jgi:[ribosomal protein S18]-alanine N-acetyltransferase
MIMDRSIVQMTAASLDDVLRIEHESFDDPWPPEAFLAELTQPWSYFKLIGVPYGRGMTQVDGFVICWMLPGDLHVLNLAIARERRRQGLGRTLMFHCLDMFADRGGGLVNLEVRESNRAAQELYRSIGFSIVGRRRQYYRRSNEDAILMLREISAGERIPRIDRQGAMG